MGLFGSKPKVRKHIQDIDPRFRGTRKALGTGFEELLGAAPELRGRLGEIMSVPSQRISAMLQSGDYYGPYQQRALDVAREQTRATREQFMGGYDPEQQARAIDIAYTTNAPEAVKSVLTRAGMQAPGITHGRVREEAARTAGNLYDEYQRAKAEQNLASAQFARGGEQLAQQMRQQGATSLQGWGDIVQRQAQMSQILAGMEQLPWEAQMKLMSMPAQFNPWQWTQKEQMYTKPGSQGALGGILGGLGGLAGGMFGGGGFASLIGGLGGGGSPATASGPILGMFG